MVEFDERERPEDNADWQAEQWDKGKEIAKERISEERISNELRFQETIDRFALQERKMGQWVTIGLVEGNLARGYLSLYKIHNPNAEYRLLPCFDTV